MSERASERIRAWTTFFLFVGFIAFTLEIAFQISTFLRARGFLMPTVGSLFVLASFAVTYFVAWGAGIRSPARLLCALPALVLYVDRMIEMRKSPAERFHFLEYALLYLFALRAVSIDCRHWLAYVYAFALTAAAGAFDEWLQGMTPGRYFDVGDIRMNAVAAALAGFILISLFRGRPELSHFPHLPRPRGE